MTHQERTAEADLEARRAAIIVLAGLAAFVLSYLAAIAGHRSLFFYEPLHREFIFGPHAAPPAMGYYGWLLQGTTAYTLAAGIAWVVLRRKTPGLGMLRGMSAVAGSLVLVCVVWGLWP